MIAITLNLLKDNSSKKLNYPLREEKSFLKDFSYLYGYSQTTKINPKLHICAELTDIDPNLHISGLLDRRKKWSLEIQKSGY